MGLVLNGFRLPSPDLWATAPLGVRSGNKTGNARGGKKPLIKVNEVRNQKYAYVKIRTRKLYRRNESRRKHKIEDRKEKTIGDWFVKTGGSSVRPM